VNAASPVSTSAKPATAHVPIDPSEMRVEDRAFLPAALEILETPPSPVRTALILLVAALVAVAFVWAAIGRIDIVAVAQGKVQPTGRVKVVQPLETGRVVAVEVANGRRVNEGDVLVRLDPTEARAEENALRLALDALSAEILRRRAVVEALRNAGDGTRIGVPTPAWPEAIPTAIRRREGGVLTADLARIAATLAGLEAQKAQKIAEKEKLAATIAAERELIDALALRVDMRATLVDRAAGTRAALIDAQQILLEQKATLASQLGQFAENAAALDLVAREIASTKETARSENIQKIAEAERQVDDLAQRLTKAEGRTARTILVAPIAGTVQASTVTTVGQVVVTAEELMRIVPEGSTLEVEAYLPNKDIGFVRPGDEVAVKFEAFPFTRYGTVPGRVVKVAADAVPEQEAVAAETGQTSATNTRSASGRSQRVQNLVFPVTIALDRATISVEGADVPLTFGMAVVAEIKTGRRTILEYLFSPVAEVASQAAKER
jgi:hemolysin D